MRALALFSILTLALSACVTAPPRPGGAVTPSGDAKIPSGPIDLGNWRKATEADVLNGYSRGITRRYGVGVPINAAVTDLAANQFRCTPPSAGRGDPPDKVCRRQVSEAGCVHTWQTHLWDDAPGAATKVTRVRGLYDRRCNTAGAGGLLGGPN